MTHWEVIVLAYGLTFLALAMEVALLRRRRRAALRQIRLLAESGAPGDPEATAHPDDGNTAGI
jgi:heme exporter protein CcmD